MFSYANAQTLLEEEKLRGQPPPTTRGSALIFLIYEACRPRAHPSHPDNSSPTGREMHVLKG